MATKTKTDATDAAAAPPGGAGKPAPSGPSKAEVAAAVGRAEDEVLAFRVLEDGTVRVVTTDGQKLEAPIGVSQASGA